MEAYLVCHIDEGLGIIPGEVSDHLNLITVRENHRDQKDTFARGESITDQPFPGWDFTAHEEPVELTNV